MTTNKNYNVCTKCGASNSVTARFCYQCGGALQAIAQPIECPKCKTVNNGNARFCKNCGGALTVSSTKICPDCGTKVSANDSICSKCNHNFGVAQSVAVSRVSEKNAKAVRIQEKQMAKADKKLHANKARVGNLFAMLFALIGAYALLMPEVIRVPKINFGVMQYTIGASSGVLSGFDAIWMVYLGKNASFASPYVWVSAALGVCGAVMALYAVVCLFRFLFGKPAHLFSVVMLTVLLVTIACTVLLVLDISAIRGETLAKVQAGYYAYGGVGVALVLFILSFVNKRASMPKQTNTVIK